MKKVQPILFYVPSPFPHQNYKVVPWKYASVSIGGEDIQFPNAEIVNISSPRGMTRCGHVFAPKYTPKVVQRPATFPNQQVGASVCVPTILVGAPDSSMSKGTSGNLVETTTLSGKDVISEKE